jgi:DNA uptake protein ComE-like DNA-binding protein
VPRESAITPALALAWLLLLAPIGLAVCRGGPASPGRPSAAPGPAERLLFGGRLDPNHAPAHGLELLPELGPSRASAIVEGRRAGPYCSIRDLERVRGIGPATRRRVEVWLEVSEVIGDCEPAID